MPCAGIRSRLTAGGATSGAGSSLSRCYRWVNIRRL